ncbi:MAG: hypothetical protein FWE42_00425 [Defluviitaleaceae bacterium]|nr:hypothetical protein [Defluviitaleaceae bacterium]
MSNAFPRVDVAGVSLSRMIIGTNWLAGWSHRSPSADNMIKTTHSVTEPIVAMLTAYMENGIDTIMGPFDKTPVICEAIKIVEEKFNRPMILVDTPIINVADSKEAREEARATIKRGKELGATFSLPHHSSMEELVDKHARTIRRVGDYTSMVREAGMIPGLSAHMPELIVYSDENGYDVETYIQIYNCLGFLMQVEVEAVAAIIHKAKKPVMTIKSMAAGRVTPYVGLNFSWATLRPCDMVTVGAFHAGEVYENIEISRAAFEGRYPNLEGRSSPNTKQAALKG